MKKPIRKLHIRSVKPGSRADRRQRESKSNRKWLLDVLASYGANEAKKNRPAYVAAFFGTWEGAAGRIKSVAERMLNESQTRLTGEDWNGFLEPYQADRLTLYRALMDRLNLDEEERFLAACDALNHVWQQLFSTILVRHPELAESVARLEAARQQAQDALVPLFTGEAKPILSPAWGKAMLTLQDGFAELAKGVGR